MTLLVLSLLLAVLGVAVFPCWRYSARWGYLPSATIGVLLVVVALLAVGGKSLSVDMIGERADLPRRVAVQGTDRGIVPAPPELTRMVEHQQAAGGVAD